MFKGLIDLHTHGIGDHSTKTTDAEEILHMAALHAKADISAILPTIYSGTIERMRKNMEAVKRAMELQQRPSAEVKKGRVRRRSTVRGQRSTILGLHLEGPFLNPARCGAQDRKSFIKPCMPDLKRLINGYEDIIKIITIAPEIPGSLKVIERCASLGIRVNMGHSDATFNQALKGKKAGASGISHLFNAMRPFHHRETGIAGFGLTDDDIFIEVIADGFHLEENTLNLIMKAKRPERIILVSDTVKGSCQGRRSMHSKSGLLAGGAVTLSEAVSKLVKTGIPRRVALKFASANPMRYLRSGVI